MEPGSWEQSRSDARMAVAAAVAAAVATAGLRGKRFKRAPQTRRTSPDQPPSPTPPPAAFLSAPSVPPAAPNPGYPAAAWAGSDPALYSLRQQVRPGSEAGLCSPRADSPDALAAGGQISPLLSSSQRIPERPPPPIPLYASSRKPFFRWDWSRARILEPGRLVGKVLSRHGRPARLHLQW